MRHAVAMVIVSAGAMIVEIVAVRMMAPLVGMTVFSWTAVITTVLAGLSVGHWIGGRIADGDGDRVARRLFGLLAATAAATTTPVLLVEPVHALAEAVGLGWMTATVAIAGTCFLAPSLLAGAVTPVLTASAVAAAPARTGAVIGRMFALGAAGAILGTGLGGFVLLQWVGSIGSLALVAVAEALVAGLYLGRLVRPAVGLAVLLAVLAGQGLAFASAPYCRVESRYYCLDVVDTTAWAGFPSRGLFMDGWIQSVEPRGPVDRLAIDSHAFLNAWATRHRAPGAVWRAFFVGGGGFSLPMRWVRRWPGFDATVAEIDPAVTAFAASIGFRQDDPRIRVRDDDARTALRRDRGRYDLVFSDAYSGHAIPAHLVTVEFHREVRARLADGGVYAINTYDWAAQPRFLAAFLRSLKEVFADVVVWRSDAGPLRDGGRTPFVVLASDSRLDRRAVAEAGPGGRTWSVAAIDVDPATAIRLTDDYAPVDRLTLRRP